MATLIVAGVMAGAAVFFLGYLVGDYHTVRRSNKREGTHE